MNTLFPLFGRIGISLIFILQGLTKSMEFEHSWQRLDLKGVPMAPLVMILAIFVELIGGLSVLLGFNVKIMALIMAIYLIPTTILFHSNWSSMVEFDNFLKNLAIMGGLFMLAHHGAGPYSLDAKKLW